MDDRDLSRALATDLDAAFETLLRCHVDRIYAIALRLLGNAADAEEVAQDTFVRAYRAIGRYDARRIRGLDLRAWLAAIAVNAARNRRRRLSERQPALPLTPTAAGSASVGLPEPDAIRRAEAERLGRHVAGLPERYRVPIVLRYVDDLSFPEMAQALGRSEGTLRAQVHRGLALLRAAHDADEREELTA
ncbi:MAG TPA: sigma-70 family RNA polymerase sigma factor [Candidatus Limnocylindrales bacterium]|nr:sigma-70 family RNA polymerase sigma factor [Candidatus Limnocylindrales bacterium]